MDDCLSIVSEHSSTLIFNVACCPLTKVLSFRRLACWICVCVHYVIVYAVSVVAKVQASA